MKMIFVFFCCFVAVCFFFIVFIFYDIFYMSITKIPLKIKNILLKVQWKFSRT